MKMKKRNRKQRTRRITDPGTSTEEESIASFPDNYVPVKQQRHSHSLMFVIFQYPILFVALFFMAINLTLYTCGRIYVAIQEYLFQFYSPQRRMRQELKNSSNYEEWIETAKKIDKSLGLDQWKSKPTDEAGFDEHLLIKITNRLKRDRNPDMMHKLMATLQNSACKNDLAGVENERLYSHLHYGTKNTVEQYLNEVTKSLNAVAKSKEITVKEKIAFFKQASVTYGRTALCLSGGAYLAYFHLGVLKALFEN
ncbi:hypothetical protein HDV02_001021, partial [Globomyces sp. JEL0801]